LTHLPQENLAEQSPAVAPPALRGVRAAFAFLTAIPVGGFPYNAREWRWASAHFPLIGACLGGLLLAVWWGGARLGAWVAAVLVAIAAALLTGALHEDALADTADALGGGGTRERIFEILKDSRIGTYGALAIVLPVLLRITLYASLLPVRPALLVAVTALARTPCVWLLAALDYVTPDNVARNSAIAGATWIQAAVATAWSAAVLALSTVFGAIAWEQALGMAAAAAAVGVIAAFRYRARVGGVTGDLLGATVPISECAMLLAAALVEPATLAG
jgi:adenosylcobinamide-GDP ribazoletransferase